MLDENPLFLTQQTLILHVRLYGTKIIRHWHRKHTAAIQVPSRLQSAAFWEPLLLHFLRNENRLSVFLSCRSWSTVSMLTLTVPLSEGMWFILTVYFRYSTALIKILLELTYINTLQYVT